MAVTKANTVAAPKAKSSVEQMASMMGIPLAVTMALSMVQQRDRMTEVLRVGHSGTLKASPMDNQLVA